MGALDSLTILRYGHAYDGGGGMEQYLADLNRVLMERNRLRIIQVQLTSNTARVGEAEEIVGLGRMTRMSLFVDQASHARAIAGSTHRVSALSRLKAWGQDRVLFAPGVYHCLIRPWLARRRTPRREGEPENAGETVRALHRRHPLDLICLHSAGGADASEILDAAQTEHIPFVYIHHFSNDRLRSLSVRSQIERMTGVAGVCGVDVPPYLEKRFRNVSDGIDTDFFRRDRAKPLGRSFKGPVIFLPARITPSKGQADLVRAAGELKRRGLDFHVVLAGRTDDAVFLETLRRSIQKEKLADRVEFVGQLAPTELRDWYAASSILAFPTRHHEGLPRILLESQAMRVPPIVHDIGGTSEGVRDHATGFLVRPGDFADLVLRLVQLLEDGHLCLSMGNAARRLIEEQFSLRALAERHERYYCTILGPTRDPGAS
jgi:glycosyltransferase involved in cell wall biosynthesis